MDINGWDTIFVASLDIVNSALSRSTEKLVQTFSYAQDGFSASGSFGTWSIVQGGSGTLLLLQIEIVSGSMAMTSGGIPIDISGMAAVLLVNLKILPGTDSSQSLVFDFAKVGTGTASDPGSVVPHDILNSGSITTVQKAALADAIANVLVENASQISFIFATINPTPKSVTWLKPAVSGYSYLEPAGMSPVLAILSVTTSRDVSSLPLQVDPTILLGSGNAGLAIAPNLFLENVIWPGVLHSLHTNCTNQSTSSNSVSGYGLALPEVDVKGQAYHPSLDVLSLTIADTQMNIAANGDCDVTVGDLTFNATSSLTVGLTSTGESLQLSPVGTPTFNHDITYYWDSWLPDFISPLLDWITNFLLSAFSNDLSNGISQAVDLQAMVQDGPSIVTWADCGGFKVQTATLSTSMCLRGTLS